MDASESGRAVHTDWDYPLDQTRIDVDEALVRRLVTPQFPALARLSVQPLPTRGTDNAMFKLGDDLVARLPRRGWAKDGVAKEVRWLPELAANVPVAVPAVVGVGAPSEAYPWTWAIYRWLPGERPRTRPPVDGDAVAEQLGTFLAALYQMDVEGGPPPGPHNGFRGGPPAARDRWVRPAIMSGDHGYDRDELMEFWGHARALPQPRGLRHWVHGDLTPDNVLVANGSLAAVIDWGCLAVGDPACDLMIAWNFDDRRRAVLRERLPLDDAAWGRGRAAAFWQWISGVTRSEPDNEARRVIDRVLADYRATR